MSEQPVSGLEFDPNGLTLTACKLVPYDRQTFAGGCIPDLHSPYLVPSLCALFANLKPDIGHALMEATSDCSAANPVK